MIATRAMKLKAYYTRQAAHVTHATIMSTLQGALYHTPPRDIQSNLLIAPRCHIHIWDSVFALPTPFFQSVWRKALLSTSTFSCIFLLHWCNCRCNISSLWPCWSPSTHWSSCQLTGELKLCSWKRYFYQLTCQPVKMHNTLEHDCLIQSNPRSQNRHFHLEHIWRGSVSTIPSDLHCDKIDKGTFLWSFLLEQEFIPGLFEHRNIYFWTQKDTNIALFFIYFWKTPKPVHRWLDCGVEGWMDITAQDSD